MCTQDSSFTNFVARTELLFAVPVQKYSSLGWGIASTWSCLTSAWKSKQILPGKKTMGRCWVRSLLTVWKEWFSHKGLPSTMRLLSMYLDLLVGIWNHHPSNLSSIRNYATLKKPRIRVGTNVRFSTTTKTISFWSETCKRKIPIKHII